MLLQLTIERQKYVYVHNFMHKHTANKYLPFFNLVFIYLPTIDRAYKEMEIQLFDQ